MLNFLRSESVSVQTLKLYIEIYLTVKEIFTLSKVFEVPELLIIQIKEEGIKLP